VRRRRIRTIGLIILAIAAWRAGLNWLNDDEEDNRRSRREVSLDNLQVVPLTSTGRAGAAAISPDGKYVVYLQWEGAGGPGVWLRQTEQTSSVKIFDHEPRGITMAVTVGPDSTFVDVWRTNGVWRVPFLGGTPTLLVERTLTPIGWSPDGQHMTFLRVQPDGREQELVVADREGRDVRVVVSAAATARGAFAVALPGQTVVAPAWSPDGDRIAVFERLGEDVRDMGIAVFDVDDGERNVVNIRGDVPHGLGWLDDDTLVFGQALESGTPSQLWRISRRGGERIRLTNDVNRYSQISLSADADSFVTTRPDSRVGIWVGDSGADGRDVVSPSPYLSAATDYATVAWDSRGVLFTHTMNGRFEIFRINPDGGSPEAVAAGRDMAASAEGTVIFRSVTGEDLGLWKVDGSGRQPVQLFKGSVNYPSITPDGKVAVFSSSISGVQTVWQTPLAGGEAAKVTEGPVSIAGFSDVSPDGRSIVLQSGRQWTTCEFPVCRTAKPFAEARGRRPRWMPDGGGVAFIDGATGRNLFVQPLDGSPPRQLTQFTDGATIGDFAWSPDGKRLAISRATYSSDIVLFRGLKGGR